MVSTYYLIKLFKKATYERFDRNLNDDSVSPVSTSESQHGDRDVFKCRICLKKGDIPIFNHPNPDFSIDICTFGDIELCENDEHPKFLCQSCNKLLEAAVLFRKTAKKSHEILRNALANSSKHSDKSRDESAQGTAESANTSTAQLQSFFSVGVSDNCDNDISVVNAMPLKLKKRLSKVQCGICFKIITKAYYKDHFALHDQTVVKYVCDICGKSFRQRSSYRNHYFTHSSDFPHKCKLCPYRGRNLGLLKTHMRMHTGDYRYMCTECPARFLTKSNLNKHSLKHKEPTFKCDNCQRGFHSKLILERHFEADHLGIKNHICNICDKAFGYRKGMMRHQLDVHKREKRPNGRTPAYIGACITNQEIGR